MDRFQYHPDDAAFARLSHNARASICRRLYSEAKKKQIIACWPARGRANGRRPMHRLATDCGAFRKVSSAHPRYSVAANSNGLYGLRCRCNSHPLVRLRLQFREPPVECGYLLSAKMLRIKHAD